MVSFMYNEKSFKLTIIFTKIRRYLFIFFFVILGLVGAYVLSEFLTEIARVEQRIATLIMIATGISIFAIGVILTSNLKFKIQQAYLEMKLLKKMSVISYKLDKLLESSGISISDEITKELQAASTQLSDRPKKKFSLKLKSKKAV